MFFMIFSIDFRATELFISYGNSTINKVIISKIRNGNLTAEYLKQFCSPKECASGLLSYFHKLNHGLLPKRVQELINGQNLSRVPPQLVALDSFGLFFEESLGSERNLIIVTELLNLMKLLATQGCLRPTENFSCLAPYYLIPILFDKNNSIELIRNFTQCMNIVNEMVMLSYMLGPNKKNSKLLIAEKTRMSSLSFQLHYPLTPPIDSLQYLRRRALRPQFHYVGRLQLRNFLF
ncbi:unnamed protein product [Diamesa tonsa]